MIGVLTGCGNPDSKFTNVVIPKEMNFGKPIESLQNSQIDSIVNTKINKEQIVVVGSGYTGYEFFMWHKPVEKGKLFIKAFELTQNIRLSEKKLNARTENIIEEIDDEYRMYRGSTVIDEGTFNKYYPVVFELWFRSIQTGEEKKLAEKKYIIDGWDR